MMGVREAIKVLAEQSKLSQYDRERIYDALEDDEQGDTWTWDDLEGMEYNDLRSIAADYEDVHGNGSKHDIIEELAGRPVQ